MVRLPTATHTHSYSFPALPRRRAERIQEKEKYVDKQLPKNDPHTLAGTPANRTCMCKSLVACSSHWIYPCWSRCKAAVLVLVLVLALVPGKSRVHPHLLLLLFGAAPCWRLLLVLKALRGWWWWGYEVVLFSLPGFGPCRCRCRPVGHGFPSPAKARDRGGVTSQAGWDKYIRAIRIIELVSPRHD